MSLLGQTVDRVKQWGPDRNDDSKECVALLQKIEQNLEAAIRVWESVLQDAPDSTDPFTVLLSIGSERSKELYKIYLDEKDVGRELTRLTGVTLRDNLGLMDEIDVVQAYGQLQPDQTVAQKADAALQTMKERKENVRNAIAELD